METNLAGLILDDGEDENEVGFYPGFNLKGVLRHWSKLAGISSKILSHLDMEHDLEKSLIESGDGKKRPRREIVGQSSSSVTDLFRVREEIHAVRAQILSAVVKGQVDWSQ
ncbi:hypothetical protein Goari_004697 [Gossypium aridum]|uniref:Uncharacterized protein n=1 Tax=Gossypium aridum TaxID=34290 RepID=A0A7J8Y492_GOSAI|nr:hypothetical protein [Gossypium aridum]